MAASHDIALLPILLCHAADMLISIFFFCFRRCLCHVAAMSPPRDRHYVTAAIVIISRRRFCLRHIAIAAHVYCRHADAAMLLLHMLPLRYDDAMPLRHYGHAAAAAITLRRCH